MSTRPTGEPPRRESPRVAEVLGKNGHMKRRVGRLYRRCEAFFLDRATRPLSRLIATAMTLVDLRREATAVVWGRHLSRNRDARGALTALRRDVHRVEKGIIMRPRRIPFGKDYVPAMVDSLDRLDRESAVPPDDRGWAIDVLSSYFSITRSSDAEWLIRARDQFSLLNVTNPSPVLVPFARSGSPASDVTIGQLEILSARRRSVRWFDESPVDRDLVDRALLVAGQAPSACNRQNLRFHMVYGRENTSPILGTAGGTKGFGDQVPAIAVVIGRLAGYRYGFDRHAIFIDGGLASMGFLLALETLGLSSCCINWPDVGSQYAQLKKYIHLERDEQVLMMIAIGHADQDGLIPSSIKRSIDSLRSVQ